MKQAEVLANMHQIFVFTGTGHVETHGKEDLDLTHSRSIDEDDETGL